MPEIFHQPVLLNEVIQYLAPKSGNKIIDATFGGGGHALAILEKIKPGGKLLGIEIDKEFFTKSKERFSKIGEITLVNDSYANLKKIAAENNFLKADGILFDIGLSNWHLAASGRGFTFTKNEPLDMRFNPVQSSSLTAQIILNTWPKEEIEKILKNFCEEKFSKSIAEAIIEERKKKSVLNTFQLVEIIKRAIPFRYRQGRIHFATKTFQALRIAVNNELENLQIGLNQIPKVLKSGGRAAIISFHSLEDRIVKNTFRDFQKRAIAKIITKKPIRPSLEEVIKNPRSRSAKMRVLEII